MSLSNTSGLPSNIGVANAEQTKQLTKDLNAKMKQKELLATGLYSMQNNPYALGKTDAQMENAAGQAQRAANAGANAQIASMNSAALAGQGFQQDAMSQQVDTISKNTAGAGVGAIANERKLNDAIIETEKNRIHAMLDAERTRQKEQTEFWGNMGIAGVSAILAAVGGPAGLAAGAGMMAAKSGAASQRDAMMTDIGVDPNAV